MSLFQYPILLRTTLTFGFRLSLILLDLPALAGYRVHLFPFFNALLPGSTGGGQ